MSTQKTVKPSAPWDAGYFTKSDMNALEKMLHKMGVFRCWGEGFQSFKDEWYAESCKEHARVQREVQHKRVMREMVKLAKEVERAAKKAVREAKEAERVAKKVAKEVAKEAKEAERVAKKVAKEVARAVKKAEKLQKAEARIQKAIAVRDALLDIPVVPVLRRSVRHAGSRLEYKC